MIREETIKEVPGGWLRTLTGYVHRTAPLALEAVKRWDRKMVKSEGMVMTQISWETRSRLGELIVNALKN